MRRFALVFLVALLGATTPPQFRLQSSRTVVEASDKARLRMTASGTAYVLDGQILRSYPEGGGVATTLDLTSIEYPVQPIRSVKSFPLIVDFWPQSSGKVLLLELNTATLIEVDARGRVLRHVKFDTTARGLAVVGGKIVTITSGTRYVTASVVDFAGTPHSPTRIGDAGDPFAPTPFAISVVSSSSILVGHGATGAVIRCSLDGNTVTSSKMIAANGKAEFSHLGQAPSGGDVWARAGNQTFASSWSSGRSLPVARINGPAGQAGYQLGRTYYTLDGNSVKAYSYR